MRVRHIGERVLTLRRPFLLLFFRNKFIHTLAHVSYPSPSPFPLQGLSSSPVSFLFYSLRLPQHSISMCSLWMPRIQQVQVHLVTLTISSSLVHSLTFLLEDSLLILCVSSQCNSVAYCGKAHQVFC